MASLKTHIRLNRLHTWIERTEHLAELISQVQSFTPQSILGLGHGLLKLWTEAQGAETLVEGWTCFRTSQGTRWLISKCCEGRWKKVGEFNAEDRNFQLYEVRGKHLLMDRDSSSAWVEQASDLEALKEDVRQYAQESLGNRLLAIPGEDDDQAILTSCDSLPAFASEEANRIWIYLEKFLRTGTHRSIALDGPPGTGKTTIAWHLATQAQALLGPATRILRIQVADFEHFRLRTLEDLMDLLQVEVLVIDDFDWVRGKNLLSFMEVAHRKIPLIVVTSNEAQSLGPALCRPQRIDKVFPIHHLGAAFTNEFLSPIRSRLTSEQWEEAITWPIAYMDELKIRALVLDDPQELRGEFAELRERVSEGTPESSRFMRGDDDEGTEENSEFAIGTLRPRPHKKRKRIRLS